MDTFVSCTGCKSHQCAIGSPEQKSKLYYDKPFWFCYNCIGGVSFDGEIVTEIALPDYVQPTAESYAVDRKSLNL
jgi:hypothetical protein